MIRHFTTGVFIFFLIFLSLSPILASSQDSKENSGASPTGVLIITLVAAIDNSFPELGNLHPDKGELDIFGQKTAAWVKTHEFSFNQLVKTCENCRQISTADVDLYGEPAIIKLKEFINILGPALAVQIKGHESLYPGWQSENQIKGRVSFVVSQADFSLILTQIKLKE